MLRDEQRYGNNSHFRDRRNVLLPESIGKVFQFELFDKQPTVVPSDVLLAKQLTVYFREE